MGDKDLVLGQQVYVPLNQGLVPDLADLSFHPRMPYLLDSPSSVSLIAAFSAFSSFMALRRTGMSFT